MASYASIPAPIAARERGFTLIELMVVVAVIAILAAIALPQYNTYVTRSKLADGQNALANFYVAMEQWFQDNRSYANAANACGATFAGSKYFTLTCTLTGTTAYTATATGIAGQGAQGFTFTVDQTNKRITTAVPTGWALPGSNCWVTNKGGICS